MFGRPSDRVVRQPLKSNIRLLSLSAGGKHMKAPSLSSHELHRQLKKTRRVQPVPYIPQGVFVNDAGDGTVATHDVTYYSSFDNTPTVYNTSTANNTFALNNTSTANNTSPANNTFALTNTSTVSIKPYMPLSHVDELHVDELQIDASQNNSEGDHEIETPISKNEITRNKNVSSLHFTPNVIIYRSHVNMLPVYTNDNVHSYTQYIRQVLPTFSNYELHKELLYEEFLEVLNELHKFYGLKVTYDNFRNTYRNGFIIDPEVPGLNSAIVLKLLWDQLKKLNEPSAFRHFNETLDQIGTTCIQGISHRLFLDFLAFFQ